MADYISRASALVAIEHAAGNGRNLRDAFDMVEAITAARVAPVMHGRWVWTQEWCDDDYSLHCSKCLALAVESYNDDGYGYCYTKFCPGCGAMMDLKEDKDG